MRALSFIPVPLRHTVHGCDAVSMAKTTESKCSHIIYNEHCEWFNAIVNNDADLMKRLIEDSAG